MLPALSFLGGSTVLAPQGNVDSDLRPKGWDPRSHICTEECVSLSKLSNLRCGMSARQGHGTTSFGQMPGLGVTVKYFSGCD